MSWFKAKSVLEFQVKDNKIRAKYICQKVVICLYYFCDLLIYFISYKLRPKSAYSSISLLHNLIIVFSNFDSKVLTKTMNDSHLWPPPVAIFLALRVWEAFGAS